MQGTRNTGDTIDELTDVRRGCLDLLAFSFRYVIRQPENVTHRDRRLFVVGLDFYDGESLVFND